jgi:hypothetical protein
VSRRKGIGGWKLPRSGQEHPQRPHLAFRSPEALEKKKGAPNTMNTDYPGGRGARLSCKRRVAAGQ